MRLHQQARSTYSRQAEILLDSWICGDSPKLRLELQRTLSSEWDARDDEERQLIELLKRVAEGMQSCPDLYGRTIQNPVLGLYMELLQYLSQSRPTRAWRLPSRVAFSPNN